MLRLGRNFDRHLLDFHRRHRLSHRGRAHEEQTAKQTSATEAKQQQPDNDRHGNSGTTTARLSVTPAARKDNHDQHADYQQQQRTGDEDKKFERTDSESGRCHGGLLGGGGWRVECTTIQPWTWINLSLSKNMNCCRA